VPESAIAEIAEETSNPLGQVVVIDVPAPAIVRFLADRTAVSLTVEHRIVVSEPNAECSAQVAVAEAIATVAVADRVARSSLFPACDAWPVPTLGLDGPPAIRAISGMLPVAVQSTA